MFQSASPRSSWLRAQSSLCAFGRRVIILPSGARRASQNPGGEARNFLAQQRDILGVGAARVGAAARMIGPQRFHGALEHRIVCARDLKPVGMVARFRPRYPKRVF